MQEIQQAVTLFFMTFIYVLMFLAFIPALKLGWILKEWSLGLAIICYLFANSTPPHDIPSIILNACALSAMFGLLIMYIPYWFRSWGSVRRELRLLLQV
ncbi:hypothetical protein [Nodularia sp. NIES-3585]|uniref:hypothetical protein n=1 Tax=Nodularia sp. NIES-3585 TaxID=1973477 RepID=UPI000B5C2681|nr:hypothetical protein [Nodularia sp. NIES-3585]GAX38800.1 hypothetical protein NIES3585_48520 [Nodularia sp. NIES-3585]